MCVCVNDMTPTFLITCACPYLVLNNHEKLDTSHLNK